MFFTMFNKSDIDINYISYDHFKRIFYNTITYGYIMYMCECQNLHYKNY